MAIFNKTRTQKLYQLRVSHNIRMQVISLTVMLIAALIMAGVMYNADPTRNLTLLIVTLGVVILANIFTLTLFWWENNVLRRMPSTLAVNKIIASSYTLAGFIALYFALDQIGAANIWIGLLIACLYVFYSVWLKSFGK